MSYNTKQSTEILSCLNENKERHMTAEDVYLTLRQNGSGVGKTTVYRHLEKLYSDGVVRKYLSGDNQSACFQLAEQNENCHKHYHLKCTSCGKLIHAQCDFLNGLSEHILDEHDFTVDGEKTVLYGLCGECRRSKELK